MSSYLLLCLPLCLYPKLFPYTSFCKTMKCFFLSASSFVPFLFLFVLVFILCCCFHYIFVRKFVSNLQNGSCISQCTKTLWNTSHRLLISEIARLYYIVITNPHITWEHWPDTREVTIWSAEVWNRWIRLSCYCNRV